MKKASVLGGGAWGTALAKVLAEKLPEVSLWARRHELVDDINAKHMNDRYLPGVTLPANLYAEADLEKSVRGADLVLFVVPSHATREVAREVKDCIGKDAILVSATKGIENDSLMFIDEILRQELDIPEERLALLSGPSFAKELGLNQPTAVVIASKSATLRRKVMSIFHTPYLRLYESDDVIGVECGGALKNVIAIATGTIDGLQLGSNTRAALITRGLAEIARLSLVRGGSALTLAGLTGMGDLVLTCTGDLSRNRTVGIELGKGRKIGEIVDSLGHVAEGVKTAKSAYDLSIKLGVDMPITREVYRVLYEDKTPQDALRDLMARELGPEFT